MRKLLVLVIMLCSFTASFGLQPQWRFNLGGGMGYLLPSYSAEKQGLIDLGFDPEKVDHYYNKFKLGVLGNADIHYLFNRNWGAGVKYSFFTSNASLNQQAYWGFTPFKWGTEERMYVNYVGPSIHVRSFVDPGKSLLITSTASLGYANYIDNNSKMNAVAVKPSTSGYLPDKISAKTTSDSWGLDWSVGLECILSPEFSFGMDVGFFYSSFNNFKVKTSDETIDPKNTVEVNVARVYASIGLRMYLY